jgi:hypothetical protein
LSILGKTNFSAAYSLSPGVGRIESGILHHGRIVVTRPSLTSKTAPHFGHFTFASFETPAHPKANTDTNATTKAILNPFFITCYLLPSPSKWNP